MGKNKIKTGIIRLSSALFCVWCFFLFSNFAQALIQSDNSADLVVGQSGFGACDNHPNEGDYERGLNSPSNSITVGGKLIISDTTNHRVLIYNSTPTSDNAKPDVVIGQVSLCRRSANRSLTPAANTLSSPRGLASDGTKLFIADTGNNRVLIFNSIPASSDASADLVIGQADMTHNTANRGVAVAANSLNAPRGVYFSNDKLFISDTTNNRVLIFNAVPAGNGESANVAIGQADLIHNGANTGGRKASTLSGPSNVFSDETKLFVADTSNHRVLIFDSVPVASGVSADHVVGQADMTSGTANRGGAVAANTLNAPYDVSYNGTKLYISDTTNNRVLIYNSVPGGDDVSADLVIGQADMTHNAANQGTSASVSTLSAPWSVYSTGTKVLITDNANRRTLIFSSIPSGNGENADIVIGQKDMAQNYINQIGLPTARTQYYTNGAFSDGTRLFIGDYVNNRVLIYSHIPTENNAAADVVVGQPDMVSNAVNQGGTVGANTLSSVNTIWSDGEKMMISDIGNNRVLIYNHIPTSNNASADVVIGQADMEHRLANRGGAVSANTLSSPQTAYFDGKKLFIADYMNQRVLIYNSLPTSSGASADVVIGQADMEHNAANRSGSVGANTLYYPAGVYSDGTKIYISDLYNNRVLIYNQIPTENGASADVVIGQADMTHNAVNHGGAVGANTLSYAFGICSDGEHLAIADGARVLIFKSIPTENDPSADVVLGQADFTHNTSNRGGDPGANTLTMTDVVNIKNNQFFAADVYNSRVLVFNLGPHAESLLTVSATTSRDITLTLSATEVKDMMISENPNFTGASWENYATTKAWTLSEGDGTKTVYAKFRDYANFEGETLSQEINLDTNKPTIAIGNKKIYRLSLNETLATRNTSLAFTGKELGLINGKAKLYEDGELTKTRKITKKSRFRIRIKRKERNSLHTYQIKYYNANSNLIRSSAEYNILIDRIKPTFTGLPKKITKNPGDTIYWQAADNDQMKYYQYTFRGRKVKTNEPQFTLPDNLPKGISRLTVRAYDRAENRSVRRVRIKVI